MGRTLWISSAAAVIAATAALASAPAHADTSIHLQLGTPYYGAPHYYTYEQPRWVQYDRGYYHGDRHARRGRDRDRDGIPDRYDRDLDNDGRLNDRDRDRDGDGVPNRYDRRPD